MKFLLYKPSLWARSIKQKFHPEVSNFTVEAADNSLPALESRAVSVTQWNSAAEYLMGEPPIALLSCMSDYINC